MSATDHDDDLPRDAWLREALRHAPDADAAPPPKLNETILRMGRAAVAPREERAAPAVHRAPPAVASGSVGPGPLASLWAWLTRPPVAAGFAVLFLSTVVGVMWMGRAPDEAAATHEDTIAAVSPAAPTTPPATSATPAANSAAADRARAATGLPEAAKRAAEAPAVAAAPPARKPEPPPVLAKSEAPPPAVAPAAAPPMAAAPAQAKQAAAEQAARDLASAERRESGARADMAAAPAAVAPAAPASGAIETPSLSNLRFEIRRKAEAWSWQRDEGESRPMDDAMQNWIAMADRTTRPAWREGTAPGMAMTTTLRFTRDGVVRAVLRLGPAGAQLTRGGKTESVTLSAGQVAALQSALDALGP